MKSAELLIKVFGYAKAVALAFSYAMFEWVKTREKRAVVAKEKAETDARIAEKIAEVKIENAKKSDSDIVRDYLDDVQGD